MIDVLLISLVLTLLFELGYAWFWGIKGRDLLLVVWMNVLTNPLVVLWFYCNQEMSWLISTLIPELSAIFAEILLLKQFGKKIRRPVLLGICINVFSYSVGLLFNLLILWR